MRLVMYDGMKSLIRISPIGVADIIPVRSAAAERTGIISATPIGDIRIKDFIPSYMTNLMSKSRKNGHVKSIRFGIGSCILRKRYRWIWRPADSLVQEVCFKAV